MRGNWGTDVGGGSDRGVAQEDWGVADDGRRGQDWCWRQQGRRQRCGSKGERGGRKRWSQEWRGRGQEVAGLGAGDGRQDGQGKDE